MGNAEEQFHTYLLDNSALKAPVRLDEVTGQKLVQVPDLEENKRYTASGFLWVSVVQDGCPYYVSKPPGGERYCDCGSCRLFRCQQPGDIIGICVCEKLRKKTSESPGEA